MVQVTIFDIETQGIGVFWQDRYIYKAVEEARLPTLPWASGFSLHGGKACGQLLSMLEPPPQDMQEYMDSTESTGPDGGELS